MITVERGATTIIPGLAESWEVSDDELTWTYKIRQGVKWSDGQPLTAKDAAYTFNRIMTGTFEQTNYGNYVGNIEKVTVIGVSEATTYNLIDNGSLLMTADVAKNLEEVLA